MTAATVPIPIPYGLTREDLAIDPAAHDSDLTTELEWLARQGAEEELPRILTSAVILFQGGFASLADCLHTAIIWERG